jgi:hypothetical protein
LFKAITREDAKEKEDTTSPSFVRTMSIAMNVNESVPLLFFLLLVIDMHRLNENDREGERESDVQLANVLEREGHHKVADRTTRQMIVIVIRHKNQLNVLS